MSLATSATATEPLKPQTGKKTRASKAASRPKDEPPRKRSWYVSDEATKRLGIHATMEGRSESDIVDELLRSLNRYTMPSHNTRATRPADQSLPIGTDPNIGGDVAA